MYVIGFTIGNLRLYVEALHDNLEVSLGINPLSGLVFTDYDQALALSDLLDDANEDLPGFIPYKLSEDLCQNED